MTENLCHVVDSKFVNLSSQANGGAIYFNKAIKLLIFRSFFVRCLTGQTYNGGGIYFDSSKSLITFGNCAFGCVSGNGYFIFVKGVAKSNFFLNETMTANCSGSDHAVCYIHTIDLYSRMYNSSFCSSKVHCNVHSFRNEVTDSMLHHYYKNNLDIIYGANSDGVKHRLSRACLIENGRSNGNHGYIHINSFTNEVLTVNYLYAYGNDVGIPIASPYNGKIVINNSTGDKPFTYVGAGRFSTSSVIIDSSFVMTTLYKNILVCEGNKKHTCIKPTKMRILFPCFSFLSSFLN
jgi:hypothetical protein